VLVIIAVPEVVPVNCTAQLPLASVQLVGVKLPVTPVCVKLTVPVGVVEPAPLASATVAVHVVAWVTVTALGTHDTVVNVVLRAPVTDPLPLLVA
jgi:hypothetical protein